MKQKRHTPEEIIRLLRESDGSPLSREKFCQQKQISVPMLHRWRKKYGQMDEADARRLKALEKENSELKKMYAEAMLGNKILKEALEKKLQARRSAGNRWRKLWPARAAASARRAGSSGCTAQPAVIVRCGHACPGSRLGGRWWT